MPDPADILRWYNSHSAHVGEAAEHLAADYAVALDRIEALETAMRNRVSFGYLRCGMAGGADKARSETVEALMP